MVAALDLSDRLPANSDAVLVPIAAMVQAPDGGFALYTVGTAPGGGEVAQLRNVQTGQILGNRVTVSGDITPGMKVIVTGTAQVADQQPVKVVP